MLLPDIDAANVMYKTLTYTSESRNGGLLDIAAPVILTSRADSFETKTYSIALGLWQKKIIKEREEVLWLINFNNKPRINFNKNRSI